MFTVDWHLTVDLHLTVIHPHHLTRQSFEWQDTRLWKAKRRRRRQAKRRQTLCVLRVHVLVFPGMAFGDCERGQDGERVF